MAFGIAVPTTAGLIDITTIRALRSVYTRTCNSRNGSFTSTSSLLQNVIFHIETLDNKAAPSVTVSGTTVTWAENEVAADKSSSFRINFLKMV